jgi:hypoxanthine phosphoribosyltransferase
MDYRLGRTLLSAADTQARVREMARAISHGFVIPNEFVVGYGLDHGQHYRHLPYLATLEPSRPG